MFFDSLAELPKLAEKTNFSIFAADPAATKQLLEQTYKSRVLFLSPDAKTAQISVEAVRDFTALTDVKDKTDRFFVILSAEALNPAAENALLKNLEEPKAHHHFILVTKTPSALLPTVLSRAQIFYLREKALLDAPVQADEKVKALAKQLIIADTKQLIALSGDLAKKKDNPRAYALEVVGTAIEILYKSYFKTGDKKFLKRLPNLLTLYDNLAKNGHLKLHFVADLI